MGKVKSAIITALVVTAIVVLALFATISCEVPFSDGVNRYNSFISSIRMSGELTGDAYALLYPEGVISSADYHAVADDADNPEEKEEYEKTYVKRGGVYVDKKFIGDNATAEELGETEQEYKDGISKDAEILSSRYSQEGYSRYSVSVEDGFVIKVSVPTGFTYAEYRNYDSTGRSNAISDIGTTLNYMLYSGDLSLRDSDTYSSSQSLLSIRDDFGKFFESASHYAVAGNHAITLTLTDEGFEKINNVLLSYEVEANSSEEQNGYFYVGDQVLPLTVTLGTALSDKTMMFQAEENVSRDISIVLASIIKGDNLINEYNSEGLNSQTDVVALTSSYGEFAPAFVGGFVLIVLVAAIVYSVLRYKKLGLVNTIVILIYALTIIISLMLLQIELSIAGLFVALLGLALLVFVNSYVIENVRKELKVGRTLPAAIKTAYKNTLAIILEVHIVLAVVAALVAIIGVGETGACGLIFFIGVLASYALYWFTRFMWYVVSSLAKDKFAFCGFEREVDEDED